MWVSTFHSACVRILRRDIGALGYPPRSRSTTRPTRHGSPAYVLRDLNVDPKRFPARSVHATISAAKNELIGAEEYATKAATIFERRIADVYREYQARLQQGRRASTSTTCSRRRCSCSVSIPTCSRTTSERFEHVLVDEYQDTNRGQNEIVTHARPRSTATSASSATLTSPSTGCAALTSATSWSSSRRSPTHGHHARSELPVDADDPRRRQRGHREQHGAQAEEPLDREGRPATDRALPRRRRGRRGAVGRAIRSKLLHDEDEPSLGRHRRLLPHERAEPGARGAAHAGRHPLQGASAARASTTGERSRTRSRTCGPSRTPPTRSVVKRVLNVPKRGVGDTTVGAARRVGERPGHLVPRGAATGGRRRCVDGRPSAASRVPRAARQGAEHARRRPRRGARAPARRIGLHRRAAGRALRRVRGPAREPRRAHRVRPRDRRRSTTSSSRSPSCPTPTSSTATAVRSSS